MMIEHATIPAAHLVVRYLVGILHVVLFQDLGRLLIQFLRDPFWCRPVFFRDGMVVTFCFR